MLTLIKGRNGSGKSTLAKIISGEIKADKGKFFGVYKNSENFENQIIKAKITEATEEYLIGEILG